VNEKIRTIRLAPYRKGAGPRFTLSLFDTGRYDSRGCTRLGYTLVGHGAEYGRRTVIFEGDDFCGSPLRADDSDSSVASLLCFLTLRPGDTDREYFSGYTDLQKAFCDQHAESLSVEAYRRFDEKDGAS